MGALTLEPPRQRLMPHNPQATEFHTFILLASLLANRIAAASSSAAEPLRSTCMARRMQRAACAAASAVLLALLLCAAAPSVLARELAQVQAQGQADIGTLTKLSALIVKRVVDSIGTVSGCLPGCGHPRGAADAAACDCAILPTQACPGCCRTRGEPNTLSTGRSVLLIITHPACFTGRPPAGPPATDQGRGSAAPAAHEWWRGQRRW